MPSAEAKSDPVTFTLQPALGCYGKAINFDYLSQYVRDVGREFCYVENPLDADLIVFIDEVGRRDHFYREMRESSLTRTKPNNCFIFTTHDHVIPFFPGVYASVSSTSIDSSRQAAGFFLETEFNPDLTPDRTISTDILASYVGRNNHKPYREALTRIRHPDFFVRDTFSGVGDPLLKFGFSCESPASLFRESVERSLFVLCPRGYGVSSIRLFETMMMGRVPVIISDLWMPPTGIDWTRISVRIKEANVESLPRILSDAKGAAVEMGAEARLVWQRNFARQSGLRRILRDCLKIYNSPRKSEVVSRRMALFHCFKPYHFKRLVATSLADWGVLK
jgi:hypothetical protein